MTDDVRTRFAPSPTGDLHVGGARTALFNWLFTRHHGGSFLLRIEDTDFDRSTRQYIDQIQDAMEWLGLEWDEGPGVGGPHEPYFQSERLDRYRAAVDRLKAEDKVYRCYCTKEELDEQRRRQRERGEPPRYSGRCRNLSEGERREFEEGDRDFTYRYRIPNEPVVVEDIAKGDVSFPADQVGDFIVVKSNGTPSYNFAVVVDDHAMEVTHVIRGDDHLSNTPRQLYLYDALGWEPPTWCHLSMILGQDGERLSKRHGATDVRAYREQGFIPEALLNSLALLGWSPPDGVEVKSVDELIESFELDRVSRSASRFDLDKVKYLNGQHLRELPAEELERRLEPFLPEELEPADEANLPAIIEVLRDHLTLLTDFAELYETFFAEPLEPTEEALDWVREHEGAPEAIEAFRKRVEEADSFDLEDVTGLIGAAREDVDGSGRGFYLPLRIAITGRTEGPEFHEMMPVLGQQRCLKRINLIRKRVSEGSHV